MLPNHFFFPENINDLGEFLWYNVKKAWDKYYEYAFTHKQLN